MLMVIVTLLASVAAMAFFLSSKSKRVAVSWCIKAWKFLRRRWRWYLGILVIILFVIYVNGEYLSYVEALPDDVAAEHPIAWAFLLKNLVIVGGLLIAFVPELRSRSRTRKEANQSSTKPGAKKPGGETSKRWKGKTSPEEGEGGKALGVDPDPKAPASNDPNKNDEKLDRISKINRPLETEAEKIISRKKPSSGRAESEDVGDSVSSTQTSDPHGDTTPEPLQQAADTPDESGSDDVFDALRRKPKLQSTAEQILSRK